MYVYIRSTEAFGLEVKFEKYNVLETPQVTLKYSQD